MVRSVNMEDKEEICSKSLGGPAFHESLYPPLHFDDTEDVTRTNDKKG